MESYVFEMFPQNQDLEILIIWDSKFLSEKIKDQNKNSKYH